MLRILDCTSAAAVNVVVVPPSSGAVVREAGDPISATKGATDTSGLAAIYNVDPGIISVEIKDPATDQLLIAATLEIRAGAFTAALVAPP